MFSNDIEEVWQHALIEASLVSARWSTICAESCHFDILPNETAHVLMVTMTLETGNLRAKVKEIW
jgi:hypothetical protein